MPKFCTTCGKQLQFEGAEVCPSCGVRLSEPSQKKSSAGVMSKGLLIIAVLCVAIVFVFIGAAVIAAFVFGMTTPPVQPTPVPSPNYPTFTPTPSPKYITLTPAYSPVIVLSRPSVQGWYRYSIPRTQAYMYTPKGWTTTTRTMSYGSSTYNILLSYSPDGTTGVGAFGMDVTGLLGGQAALEKILKQGYIGSDMYEGIITGLNSPGTSDPVTNIVQDPNYYLISGQPARKIEYNQMNAHLKDYVVVVDKNTIIMEMMLTTSQATYDDRTKADESLRSLTV